MNNLILALTYKLGHQRTMNLEKTDYYCMGCGEQGLYTTTDGGDYYEGNSLYCFSCMSRMSECGGVSSLASYYPEVLEAFQRQAGQHE